MTRAHAGELLAMLIFAYPTQKRDEGFLELAARALVDSEHHPAEIAVRIQKWIRTEVFWPSIAELIAPFPPLTLKRLPAPVDAMPSDDGLAIFRQRTIERIS